jgi:hypothetical protein
LAAFPAKKSPPESCSGGFFYGIIWQGQMLLVSVVDQPTFLIPVYLTGLIGHERP